MIALVLAQVAWADPPGSTGGRGSPDFEERTWGWRHSWGFSWHTDPDLLGYNVWNKGGASITDTEEGGMFNRGVKDSPVAIGGRFVSEVDVGLMGRVPGDNSIALGAVAGFSLTTYVGEPQDLSRVALAGSETGTAWQADARGWRDTWHAAPQASVRQAVGPFDVSGHIGAGGLVRTEQRGQCVPWLTRENALRVECLNGNTYDVEAWANDGEAFERIVELYPVLHYGASFRIPFAAAMPDAAGGLFVRIDLVKSLSGSAVKERFVTAGFTF